MTRLVGEHFNADGRPKRGFLTKRQAKAFIERKKIENMVIYQCTFCGKWHLATEK